jgi:hypothetical protein
MACYRNYRTGKSGVAPRGAYRLDGADVKEVKGRKGIFSFRELLN